MVVIFLAAGVIIAGISLPLIQGKVRPNRFYGIRTEAAFASEENWYEINKAGGLILFKSSIPMFAVGAVGFFLPTNWETAYSISGAIVMLGSVVFSTQIIASGSRSSSRDKN